MSSEDLHRRVLQTIERWKMLSRGAHVGVAVSGGADSVALLRILHAHSADFGWILRVLHVNHKLRRPESDGDAAFVEALASQLGLSCEIANLPVQPIGNLEQEARNLRMSWFELCIEKSCTSLHKLHNVALGHTRSDQAETVLFRFLRGSGSAGLAGIRPILHNGFVRPLLDVDREDTRAYLRELGQPWREDSSNADLSFNRNRVRLELLPQLAREWNPSIETTLVQTADWARAEEEHWETLIAEVAKNCLHPEPGPAIVAPTSAFESLSTAACRRLIRHVIGVIRGNLHSIGFSHVEQIRLLIAQSEGSGRLQIPGVDILRSFDWVRFAAPGTYSGDRHFSTPVCVPGYYVMPPNESVLSLQLEDAACRYTGEVNCLDADGVSGPLVLRTWQPGDQYHPLGHPSAAKLKTLFQAARIPIWERRLWPILVIDNAMKSAADLEIIWSRQFGVAAAHAATLDSARVIRVSEQRKDKLNTVSPKPESGTGRRTSIS